MQGAKTAKRYDTDGRCYNRKKCDTEGCCRNRNTTSRFCRDCLDSHIEDGVKWCSSCGMFHGREEFSKKAAQGTD